MAQLTATPRNLKAAREVLDGWSSKKIGNNTELRDLGTHVVATLHGNHIVRYTEDGVEASWAGWASSTTRDRLNQLAPAKFNIKGGNTQIDGEKVPASAWVRVR